jgi:hypothetical protein
VRSKVLATPLIPLKLFAMAGQGASAMKEMSDQSLQFLEDGIAGVLGFIQLIWTWSSDQIVKMTQAPWDNWPLWKQILFIIVVAFVIYALFIAAKQLWLAGLNVLAAIATFVGTLIVTLPTILIAGVVALVGLWIINNFHDISSLRSLVTFQGGTIGSVDGTGSARPGVTTRQDPAETTGSR